MENSEKTQPELNISDLQNIKTLIEVAVRRGTFNAAELSSVGAVFDRLNVFLSSVQAAPTQETNSDQAPTA